jgi:hypothetical protein
MAKRIEDKIMDILNNTQLDEGASWENLGGPTPSETLKGPIDYAKNVQKAHVPQAHPIPGVGEIGNEEADQNDPITDVVDDMDEDEIYEAEDEDEKDDEEKEEGDGDEDEDDEDEKLEETFSSLLQRLAEEDVDEDEGETSLKDADADFGTPEETLPDVDSKLENPESLLTKAPGIKVAEEEMDEEEMDEDEGETSLKDADDDFGTPEETLPDVDSKLDKPDSLVTPAVGAKAPNPKFVEHDTDVKEDLDAVFAGTKLSEAAKAKAATIFKAAVIRRVNEEKTRVQQVATRKLKEAFAILKARSEQKQNVYESKLTGQVDRYLNYVVENWMDDNRLAVEKGIRAELAESFITGLKNLFVEHYIEVPESKVDVLATLGKKVTKLESKLNESIETNTKMRASLNAYRKEEVVRAVSGGLAETQREKLTKLAEGVDYTTRKEFAAKLVSLKEAYFPKSPKTVKREEQPLLESVQKPVNSEMAVYTKTLSKMNKKD